MSAMNVARANQGRKLPLAAFICIVASMVLPGCAAPTTPSAPSDARSEFPVHPDDPALRLTFNGTKSFPKSSKAPLPTPGYPVDCPSRIELWYDAAFSSKAVGKTVSLELEADLRAPPHTTDAPRSVVVDAPYSTQLPFGFNITSSQTASFSITVRPSWSEKVESVVESVTLRCAEPPAQS